MPDAPDEAAIRADVRARVRALGCASDDTAPCPPPVPRAPRSRSERRGDAGQMVFWAVLAWGMARFVEAMPSVPPSFATFFDGFAVVAAALGAWLWSRGMDEEGANDA